MGRISPFFFMVKKIILLIQETILFFMASLKSDMGHLGQKINLYFLIFIGFIIL